MSRAAKDRVTRSKTKNRERDEHLAKQTMQSEGTPVWAEKLSTQIANMDDTFQHKFVELNASVKEIQTDMRAMVNRIGNAEKRISELEDKGVTHEATLQDLTKEMSALKNKVSYLESQSRRNNLIFTGLDEGLLEHNADQELAAILRYILDRGDEDPVPEAERHHRALRPRPSASEPPRPYIVKLLRWSDRQLLLQRATQKKHLAWKGKAFRIYPDFPADVQLKRKEYAEIKDKLRRAGVRYGLLFPARLMVTIDGQKKIYKTPGEAVNELRKCLPSVFG